VWEELKEAEENQEGDTTRVLEKSSCFTDSVRKTGSKTTGGRASAVGKIAAEESDCSPEGTSTRVSCFKENIMEDVGDMERC